MYCFDQTNKTVKVSCYPYTIINNTLELVRDLLVVQLSPVQPAEHIHHPSVCRHVSGLQSGEQNREQFVPKCPFLQATGQNKIKDH